MDRWYERIKLASKNNDYINQQVNVAKDQLTQILENLTLGWFFETITLRFLSRNSL
jgi:hypothetical protein